MNNKIFKIIYIICFVLIVIFSGGLYLLKHQPHKQDLPIPEIKTPSIQEDGLKNSDQVYLNAVPSVDLEEYRTKYNNNDIKGRLLIPDLFDVIVTQTSDNAYYLNHNIEKKKDPKGCEFLDYRTTDESKQINIYGHNSRLYDLTFKNLEKYKDETFYNENTYIIYQNDKIMNLYQIFSFKTVSDNEHMFINREKDELLNHINILKSDAIHSTNLQFDYDSELLILQTCVREQDGLYYILCAKKVATKEL